MECAVKQDGPYKEWPVESPVSRNFDCEIVAPSVCVDGTLRDFDKRLKLRASTTVVGGQRECWVSIILPDPSDGRLTNWERWQPVRPVAEELRTRGLWAESREPRYGSWRRYLLEVAKAHAALEILGWTLTDEEQALMAALDEYGQQAPARYVAAA